MAAHARCFSCLARWRAIRWALAALLIPFGLWACTAHSLEAPVPVPEQQNDQYFQVNPSRDIDILFVVDNSPSMSDKQNNLVKNFPVFMEELKKIKGGLPNVHIGVVSSDVGAGPTRLEGGCERMGGDRGILQAKASCELDAGARFIVSVDNGRTNNFQGDISRAFSCIAALGDRGCGYEHQLQATRLALYESATPDNKGFLRPDAYLGIIMLTDEDDCSADPGSNLFADEASFRGTTGTFRCAPAGHLCDGKSPPLGPFETPLAGCASNENGPLFKVADMVTSIRQLKQRPDEQIIVAAITGWTEDWPRSVYRYGRPDARTQDIDYLPLCEGANGKATPALRIKQFVEAFGANGSIHSICADDFRPAMETIGNKLAAILGDTCIDAPLADTKPEVGVQPDCSVVDRVPVGAGFADQVVRPCSAGGTPCWKVTPANCKASGFKIEVDRGGSFPPQGTQQVVRCLTCATPDDLRCKR
jgi:hypothetical protein